MTSDLTCAMAVLMAASVTAAVGQTRMAMTSGNNVPFSINLASGIRLSISQGPNQAMYVDDSDLFSGYPTPRGGEHATLRGPVHVEPEAGVCMRQIVVNPIHGFLYSCRNRPGRETSNSRAVGDLITRASPARVWMEWEGTVDTIATNGDVLLRDIDRYTVIPFDLNGVARQAAFSWRQSWNEFAQTIRNQQTPRGLLTMDGQLDTETVLSRIATVPETLEDDLQAVFYDPEREVTEIRWPRIDMGNSTLDGREISLGIERRCLVEMTAPPRGLEIAVRLSKMPVLRATVRQPVLLAPPVQPLTNILYRPLQPIELPVVRTSAVPLPRATLATNALIARPYPGNPQGIVTTRPVRVPRASMTQPRLPSIRQQTGSAE
ncbi:MAG TPA: hypothetical protein PLE77_04355 [Kiritimatiellia bacterium]|nr:hypothetical protein [Kiritimatiellia bacterium]